MKKWCRLLLSMVLLFLSCTAFAAGYDQTSPAATMQSFILAMLRNDSRAFYHLTKDVIPLSYFETDLLEFSNREMSGSKFSDYYYYEFEENTFVLYNSLKTPSPQIEDFFCMQLVRADGEYYISDLYLPHHSRGLYSSLWNERCNQAIQTEGKCLAYVKMAADAGKKTDIKGNTDGFELSGTILVKYTGNSSSVIIPDGITGIYDYAFAQNDTINSVIIPDSVTAIGEFSFYNCTSLENIQFSSSMKSIAASAFYGCVSIREIALPEGIDCISGSLFRGCKSLEDVVIPPSVKTIENNAFSGCHMLDYLTIPESVTYINNNAFDSGFGLNLRVVAGSRAERFARDYWFDYEYYTPDENTVKLVPSFEPVYEDYFDYDLSSRQSAAESYMWAMLNGDSAALKELAKDIIPWYYLESDLLKHGTNIMTGSRMSDFCYFELADNTIIVYDKRVTPSPDVIDFYCMDFVEANGLYYISELHLPKYSRGIYESKWNERCKTIIESGRVLTNNTNEINSVSSLTGAAIVSSSSCQETQNHILGELQGSIEPTCTSPGQTGSILCILCGDQIQLSEVIPATGHIPSELQNAIKPTCTIPGQTGSILCTLCGNQIQSNETIPATGHNLGEYRNSAAASCIREGYTGDAQCSLCNEIVPGNIIPKTAHLLVNNICSICNAQVYEVNGFQPMKVSIALDDADRIVSIDVIKHSETPGFGASLIEAGFDELIGQHISSAEFDAVSGATFTSKGINEALKRAASKY